MFDKDVFAASLRGARSARGMTQAELAAKSGVEVPSIGAYERGETVPLLEAAIKLADALDVSVDKLVAGIV